MSKGLRSFLNRKLEESKELSKMAIKPQSSRQQYRGLYEWSRRQLGNFELVLQENQESQISAKALQNQKKVVISMLLEMSRIAKQQCLEKGQIIEELLHYAIQYMNQHQKYYDMLSYTQIKHFRDSISELEKEYHQKNQQLQATINSLSADKEHRWRNIFMVVKDNRVLRRQKAKLIRKHKQEVWRTKQLEEDLINVRSQNEKYKIMCQQYKLKQNELKYYVTNQLLLLHLDQKVRQYPGRARRLLKKELLNCQINELNTLEEKIKFIIQAMEQNNEVCQEFDDWDDNTNTTRLFYNVSVQTYIQMQSVAVNTTAPAIPKKVYQSTKAQTRYRDFICFESISKNVDVKILPNKKAQLERKKTQDLSLSMSRFKRKASITSANLNQLTGQSFYPKPNDFSGLREKLKINPNTVSLKLCGIRNGRVTNFTSMVLNVQGQTQSGGADVKTKQEQNAISQINLSQKNTKKNKFKKISKPEPDRHFERIRAQEKEHILYKQPIKNIKMWNQMIQLYFNPKSSIQVIDLTNLPLKQPAFYYDEKRLGDEEALKQKTKSISDKVFGLYGCENFGKPTKNENGETITKNLGNNQNFSIPEVHQVASNRTLLSETHDILGSIQLEIENDKSAQQITKNSLNKLGVVEKIKKINEESKNKLQIFEKRHKRQNTENLETRKSKEKIQQLIKYKGSQNKMEQKFDKNTIKLRIRNHNVCLAQENEEDKPKQIKKGGILDIWKDRSERSEIEEEKRTIKNEKLVQKLMNAIFLRRKDVITNPQSMRVFAHSFLLSVFDKNKSNYYVNKIRPQALFYNSIKNVEQKQAEKLYSCVLLQYLLPTQRCELFAEDMMVLFAIMLDKLNSMGVLNSFGNLFHVPYQYCLRTIQYLCSIYLSPEQSLDFILSKIRTNDQPKGLNMIECFLKLYLHLDKIIFQSELWQFLNNISRWSVDGLSEAEISEIFTLVRLMDAESESHFGQITYYCNKSFPLHRFCLFAHRFGWKGIYSIKTWIQDKYLDYFGLFSFTASEANALCAQLQLQFARNKKLNNLWRILKQMHFKHRELGVELNQNFIKLCRLTISLDEMEDQNIYPPHLLLLQQSYRKYLQRPSSHLH